MEASSKSQQVTVVVPRLTNHFVECFLNKQKRLLTTQNIFVDCLSNQQNVEHKISVDGRTQKSLGRLSLEPTKRQTQRKKELLC